MIVTLSFWDWFIHLAIDQMCVEKLCGQTIAHVAPFQPPRAGFMALWEMRQGGRYESSISSLKNWFEPNPKAQSVHVQSKFHEVTKGINVVNFTLTV